VIYNTFPGALKNIYQRPRPTILHLVEEKGFSFPSGHSLAVTLMVGTLIIILSQRIKNPVWRKSIVANISYNNVLWVVRKCDYDTFWVILIVLLIFMM
jgi:membrane-associated phospholipid phosphatase